VKDFSVSGSEYCYVCSARGSTSETTAAACVASNSVREMCPVGDYCGVEVRMNGDEMVQINMRCMQPDTCVSAREYD
jgi:hypothetical protein